jgi:NAD(P)H-hydrate epimerase
VSGNAAVNEADNFPYFITEDGLAVPAVTATQMASLGEAIVNGSGVRMLQLMENAGRNAAVWILGMAGSGPLPRVLVLAGPDNNGAIGLCAARHLANHDVDVALAFSDPTHLSGVALQQRKAFRETPGRELSIERLEGERPDVVVDALAGYISAGPFHARAAQAIEWTNSIDADIVSLGVPSGVDATTGEAAGMVVFPHVTVTFALPFTGLHEANAGEIILADVGIPVGAFLRAGIPYTSPFDRRYWVKLRRHESRRSVQALL